MIIDVDQLSGGPNHGKTLSVYIVLKYNLNLMCSFCIIGTDIAKKITNSSEFLICV